MTTDPQIYLVDDDEDFREATREILEEEGLSTRAFSDGSKMLDVLDPEWGGVILCDVRMGGMDGFAVLEAVRRAAPEVPFIMITGHGDVRLAIAAIKKGAHDFLEKPVQPDFLLSVMQRTLNARKLVRENKRLRQRAAQSGGMRSRFIGRSRVVKECRTALINLAPLPMTVTLSGETGTGKAMAAQMLHDFGEGEGDFATISCGTATAQSLKEDLANVSSATDTLFFRAIHKLDHISQTILSDYLRQSDRPRVVVSFTSSPDEADAKGLLSDELYFLTNVAKVELPPLKDREKDKYLLLEAFLREAAFRFDKRLPKVTKETLALFERHSWPGNVRELRNVAERMVIGLPVALESRAQGGDDVCHSYDEAMHQFERSLLEQTLRETGGRKGDAAELLSIPRKRLYLRMKAVGLSKTGQE